MDEKELEKIFKGKKEKQDKKGRIKQGFKRVTFKEFQQWFLTSEFEKGCHYCGTTNQKSYELFKMQRTGQRPDGTRGGKRGRRLEIERKEPNKSYDDLKNIVWCCYWCNNAKSNFFTEEEFSPIAKTIGNALKKI